MDSMADTSCAGSNWRVIEETGFTCDVYPFKEGYEAVKDVPIATCATLVEGERGGDFILIGHEMLYFGQEMKRSLLNQNQIREHIRHNQGRVQDDYTRVDEDFGIITNELFVPFNMDGSAVYFESRVPSQSEMDNLPHFVITSKDRWDPHGRPLRVGQLETGIPTNRGRDEFNYNGALWDVSPILVESELRERIIQSVNVKEWYEKGDTYENIQKFYEKRSSQAGAAYARRESYGNARQGLYGKRSSQAGAVYARHRHTIVSAETLSKLWNIGLETAQRTLRVTTQNGLRTAVHPITRRYRVDHLHLHRRRLHTTFYTDTMFSKVQSLRGNRCAQVFTDGRFTAVYPLTSKMHAGDALRELTSDVGVPDSLIADLAGEQSGDHTEFLRQIRRFDIRLHHTEKGRKNQNHKAEREIGILKTRWKRRMTEKSVPSRLWDYGLVYEAEIMSRMCRGDEERSGLEILTGETPDISEWSDFTFFDIVWYHVASNDTTTETRRLGRWLGISHRVGSDLCYWILTESGKVISSTTVQHVTTTDASNPSINRTIIAFDQAVNTRLDDTNFTNNDLDGVSPYIQDIHDDHTEVLRHGIIPSDTEYGDMVIKDNTEADAHPDLDNYIHAQLLLDVGGEQLQGRVIKRAKEADGTKKGRAHQNPLFDTRAYLVEFKDGSVGEYTANIIAENIYSQVDSEGRSFSLLKEISGHRKDPNVAIKPEDGFILSANGNKVPKRTTRGWSLQVEWKGGEQEWIQLKDLKASNPVEVAEYAIANEIDGEPAFDWWVKDTIRHRRRIVSKVKSKYWRTTHKFGIRLPHTVEEALRLDKESGTDFWARAIEKERRKVKVAWEVRNDLNIADVRSGKALIGFTEIKCHMIFDVKMDFTRKARFVAGGHMTSAPSSITYSSVVSRDSVRLAFLIAELNGLEVMACDVGNAYLNAPCREKVWFLGGAETGEDRGKVLVITRALYGLKSSGASWRATLAHTLVDLGFEATLVDPDVWRRPARRADGTEYYELCLVYVDDILLISHDPRPTLLAIGRFYELKEGSLGTPSTYLGAQVYQHYLRDGRKAWGMSSEKYTKNAVNTVESLLQEDGDGYHLKTTAKEPLPSSYRPELDISNELGPALVSRYRQLIGILRWAVEIGRVDVYYEVAILSQYLASPREGHLEAAYHIFAYFKTHQKFSIVFDPRDTSLDESTFQAVSVSEWRDFYGDVAEELPPKMPEPRGQAVDITCFVDANHAGNVITRRSHTGVIIFVQNAPIIWFSKKQNTVESSSFGSEFVALRVAKDMIISLRYKLRMFGVPLRGPASVLCDNQGVVKNASLPESALSKRHNAINYHSVREAVAAGIIRVGKEDGVTNLADVFTKSLPRPRRYELFSKIGYSSMFGNLFPPGKRDAGDLLQPALQDGGRTKFIH
jgi:hypothetical protein